MVEVNSGLDTYLTQYLKDHPEVVESLTQGRESSDRLTGRERLVLRLRLGYESEQTEGWTQQQVGEDPRIMRSRRTIGRIERAALSKLGLSDLSQLRRPIYP